MTGRDDAEPADSGSADPTPTAYAAAYCPRCGTATGEKVVDGRERTWCPECDVVHWRAAVPVVGVALVDDGEVLTFHHSRTGSFDLPSGHQELPESAPETASRELEEETGLRVDSADLSIFDVTVKEHPLGRYNFSTTYVATVDDATGELEPETEADVVEWTTPTAAREREADFVPGVVDVVERAVDAVAGSERH
ncbi:NUDIX domain-containing protein [Halorubellus sp. JP-L1]|uniref:NUDIX domain-containing protein n=1 Tax=Halorubellus sp. JP-L1 TaxID=2715753 RepID=UPI00140C8166|nr:NUDIX domain-containing protein [Halorubellus sp. JP-L1]NHN43105.1 NUDIX domain-containing protein [Halorubellus sp. JP-L1]